MESNVNVYINYSGDCRAAVTFYAKVFELEVPQMMTYGQMPHAPADSPDKDRILHATLPIMGSSMMFADCPSDFALVQGNNVAINLGFADKAEIARVYEQLSKGGTVIMPLGPTFFAEQFAMFADKFGILWQLSL